MLFTQPTRVQENIIKFIAFQKLYEDEDYGRQRTIEEAVAWAFLRLYTMLTDWQNIVKEGEKRLQASVSYQPIVSLQICVRSRLMFI